MKSKGKTSLWKLLLMVVIIVVCIGIGHTLNSGIPNIIQALIYLFFAFVGWLSIIGMYYYAKDFGYKWPISGIVLPLLLYSVLLFQNIDQWGEPSYIKLWFITIPLSIVTIWCAFIAIFVNDKVWEN